MFIGRNLKQKVSPWLLALVLLTVGSGCSNTSNDSSNTGGDTEQSSSNSNSRFSCGKKPR